MWLGYCLLLICAMPDVLARELAEKITMECRLAFRVVSGKECADMKQFIFSILSVVAVCGFISCERHEWEDSSEGKKDGTKNLYSHGDDKKTSDDSGKGH